MDFVIPTAEEMEDSLQMCRQGAGGPGAKAEDGKLVTRRKAAQYKRSRAAKGTKGSSKLVTPAPGSASSTRSQQKAKNLSKTKTERLHEHLKKRWNKLEAVAGSGMKISRGQQRRLSARAANPSQSNDKFIVGLTNRKGKAYSQAVKPMRG